MYIMSLILGHKLTIFLCKCESPLRQNVSEVFAGKFMWYSIHLKLKKNVCNFWINCAFILLEWSFLVNCLVFPRGTVWSPPWRRSFLLGIYSCWAHSSWSHWAASSSLAPGEILPGGAGSIPKTLAGSIRAGLMHRWFFYRTISRTQEMLTPSSSPPDVNCPTFPCK